MATFGTAAVTLLGVLATAAAAAGPPGTSSGTSPTAGRTQAPGRWGPDGYRSGPVGQVPATSVPPVRQAPGRDFAAAAAPVPMRGPAPGDGHGPPPRGYAGRYATPYRGWTVPPTFVGPDLQVADFAAWGLSPPGPGLRWIRYYDDAVLIDGRGRVQDVRYAFGWNRAGRGPGAPVYEQAYDDGYEEGYRDGSRRAGDAVTYGDSWSPQDGGTVVHRSSGVTVYQGAGSGRYPAGATVVVVGGVATAGTTTTTVTEEVVRTPSSSAIRRSTRSPGKTVRRYASKSR